MKRYEKLTATFIVVGDREDRYKAVEYTKFVEYTMDGQNQVIRDSKRYALQGGGALNINEDQTFTNTITNKILRRV